MTTDTKQLLLTNEIQNLDTTKIVPMPPVHITNRHTSNQDLILVTNILLDELAMLGAEVTIEGSDNISSSINITWKQYDRIFQTSDTDSSIISKDILPPLQEQVHLIQGFDMLTKISEILQLIRAHITLGNLLPQMKTQGWTWNFVHYHSRNHSWIPSYVDAYFPEAKTNWHAIIVYHPNYQPTGSKKLVVALRPDEQRQNGHFEINPEGIERLAANITYLQTRDEFMQRLPELQDVGVTIQLKGSNFALILQEGDPPIIRPCTHENIRWACAIAKALKDLQTHDEEPQSNN